MKRLPVLAAVLISVCASHAQEKVSREDCLKYAFMVSANLKELLATPIPTDPDVKRPAGVKDGGCGAMALPETKLTAQTFAGLGEKVVPVGQLWLARLVPAAGGQAVKSEKLRLVHLAHGDSELDVPCLALGAHKAADGNLELMLYGKTAESLLRLSLKPVSATAQDTPIELSAERRDDSSGLLKLTFVGKYQATLEVRLAGQ